MSEVEIGKDRVIEELRGACGQRGLEIDHYKWEDGSHFDLPSGSDKPGPTLYALEVIIGGRRELVKFPDEELTDLPLKGHLGATARQAVMEKLKELLDRFKAHKARIGF